MKLIGNAFILGCKLCSDLPHIKPSEANPIIFVALELIAETQTLADKSGVGAEQLDAFINGTYHPFISAFISI